MGTWTIFRVIHARANVCGLMVERSADAAVLKFCGLYRLPSAGAIVLYSYPVLEGKGWPINARS